MTATHTSTPWKCRNQRGPIREAIDIGGEQLTCTAYGMDPQHTEANASFIVRACNAHDELVAALEDALDRLASVDRMFHKAIRQEQEGELGQITRGRAALKLAKGEA
jgi:hypothetical protein